MKGPDWCHVLIGKVGYADRKSFMSYIICRYVLPYRSECYKLLRLCVCVCLKGQLGAKIRPVLTSGGITVKMGGGGLEDPVNFCLII